MNQAFLIGNLCRDPELRRTANDEPVAHFTLAVQRDRKNAKGEYDTDFFDVTLFGGQADYAAKYLRKGYKASVVGSVQLRTFEYRDGTVGKALEVIANKVENLQPKVEEGTSEEIPDGPAPESQNLDSIEITDDDLPF